MQETIYQTAVARVSLSDSGCRSLSVRQRMKESLYQTADAGRISSESCVGVPLLDIRCRTLSLLKTVDAGVILPDSDCMRHSIRQQVQRTLYTRQRMLDLL